MEKLILAVAGVMLAAAFLIVIYQRWETKRLFESLEEMLRRGMRGSFTESEFTESRLSRLETELMHYLSASAISAQSIEKEKNQIKTLIADISHQTKTPVANLLLYGELLEEEELTEAAREKLAVLHEQAEKLQFLIDALVKMSRMENGMICLQPEKKELRWLLEQMKEQYEEKAVKRGLSFEVKETEEKAFYDARWTAEALGNLVDNAIKYTKTGGVSVSVTAYEMFARIDVTDTGMGICEEEQARIFSRFYRSGRAAKEDHEGVGIGLFLAREIVQSEGGYLKVSSKEGEGSVFSLFLPN